MHKLTFILAILIAFGPLFAFAHPGHGDTEGFTIIHYFTEFGHAITTWPIVIAAVVLLVRHYRQHRHADKTTDGNA